MAVIAAFRRVPELSIVIRTHIGMDRGMTRRLLAGLIPVADQSIGGWIGA
jgi:hypothetical protein